MSCSGAKHDMGSLRCPCRNMGPNLTWAPVHPLFFPRVQTLQYWWSELDWTLSLHKFLKQGAFSKSKLNVGANKRG